MPRRRSHGLLGPQLAPKNLATLLTWVHYRGALVDSLFQGASFCKWVCPIGQFNFIASTVSPLEVAVREPDLCARCETLPLDQGGAALRERPLHGNSDRKNQKQKAEPSLKGMLRTISTALILSCMS